MRLARVGWFVFGTVLAAAPAPDSITAQDVIAHVEKVISWYRDVGSLAPPAVDVLIADDLHQTSLKALQRAIAFAQAESVVAGGAGAQNTASGNLQQYSAKAADRVTSVEAQIKRVDGAISKAAGKRREILEAQKKELNAELELATEIQSTVANMLSFSSAMGASSGSLAGQIDELERSVPEAQGKTAATATVNGSPTTTPFSPDSAGVLGLASELFNNHGNRAHLSDVLKSTQSLAAAIDALKTPLGNQARQSIQQSDQIASQANAQDLNQLSAAEQQVSALAGRFRQISTAIVPLNEEAIAVATAQSYLQESIGTIDQESTRTARYLLMKAVTLGIVIFLVLFIGEVWRRATFRYVGDARRRRQFLVLRRVVVAAAVLMSIVFWFVSEIGSLATYAGFVTAGVAVALQSPILAVVAYFFLIGRYGIRAGDRVTISGVTGDVIEIGLVRIYLAELAGSGADLHPTGRVVVFSNSVIFQPSALYRQMPGIDYVWHTAALVLAEDSDFQLAEKTLNAAVESFFAHYRGEIERQFRSLEQSVDLHVAAPKPESRLRFTEAGLQYTVRYPAEIARAAEMDTEILRALHQAVAQEPKLKFAADGTPKLQAS